MKRERDGMMRTEKRKRRARGEAILHDCRPDKTRRDFMEIRKTAMAGTLESSDAQITVEPGDNGIELTIESSVIHQYGRQIRNVALETLNRLNVVNGKVTIFDKGALDCTLKARIECAVYRSNGITENLPWGGVIQ